MERDMGTQDSPITLARVERALDRLAIMMTDDPELGQKIMCICERLGREAEAMCNEEDALVAVQARARRVRARE